MPKNSTTHKLSKQLRKENEKLWWVMVIGLILIIALVGGSNPAFTNFVSDFTGLNFNFTSTTDDVTRLEKVYVKRVVDGDTVELGDGRTIRYLNIDTPETVKPNAPVECFGDEAKQLNKELVENKTVYIKGDKESKDRYDRYLRFVFLNSDDSGDITKSVNAYIVQYGFATTLFYSPNTTFKSQFQEIEKRAKANNLGLWADCQK